MISSRYFAAAREGFHFPPSSFLPVVNKHSPILTLVLVFVSIPNHPFGIEIRDHHPLFPHHRFPACPYRASQRLKDGGVEKEGEGDDG
ncbi:MAG: hypothetical protein ACK4Z6_06810 [Candidatus Methylomirabilales bacterium]